MPEMISLGRPMEHLCPAEPTKVNEAREHDKMVYPSLFIDVSGKDLDNMAMEGRAVVKYRIVRDSKTITNKDGEREKNRNMELEILAIAPAYEDGDTEDSIDKLRLELTGE